MASAQIQKLKVLLMLGSVRPDRMSDRVAHFVSAYFTKNNHTVDILDPMQLKLPMLEKPLHFYQKAEEKPAWLLDLNRRVAEADSLVIITAEYNRNLPPALSNMIDHIPPNTFQWKPTAIVGYSLGAGGALVATRHLASMLFEFGAILTPGLVMIPKVHLMLNEDGTPVVKEGAELSFLERSGTKLVSNVEWVTTAVKAKEELSGKAPLFSII